jgi:predicted signal transduction protein with EAL and GGDEF domain
MRVTMDAVHPDASPARSDALTGLPGRDAARARLADWLERGEPVHGLLIGLRRFDAVNLAYGNAAGDAALAEVAARIRHFAHSELEGAWIAARGGGGQFLLMTTEPCSRERWQMVSAQLLDRLALPITVGGNTLRLSPRGALLRSLGGEEAWIRCSTGWVRRSSTDGRRRANGCCWADGEATRAGRSAAQLESDLLRALDRGEIEVVYQPQWSCADDRLSGAEALARWNHPQAGADRRRGAVRDCRTGRSHVAQLSRHIAPTALGRCARTWPDGPAPVAQRHPQRSGAGRFCAGDFAGIWRKASGFPALGG